MGVKQRRAQQVASLRNREGSRPLQQTHGVTITREELIDVISAWELAAARDPASHTYDTPEAKAEHLWQLLIDRGAVRSGIDWSDLQDNVTSREATPRRKTQ